MREELRAFIVENYLFGGSSAFSDDDSFLAQGLIDSSGVLELVAFIERQYNISVDDSELVPDNLDSINSLLRFVQKKLQTGVLQS